NGSGGTTPNASAADEGTSSETKTDRLAVLNYMFGFEGNPRTQDMIVDVGERNFATDYRDETPCNPRVRFPPPLTLDQVMQVLYSLEFIDFEEEAERALHEVWDEQVSLFEDVIAARVDDPHPQPGDIVIDCY